MISKVVVVGNAWWLMGCRCLTGLEGKVEGTFNGRCKVRFPKGSVDPRHEAVLEVDEDNLVPLELYASYLSGKEKLTQEEKIALRIK